MGQQHDGINLGPMNSGLILKSNFILSRVCTDLDNATIAVALP
jgi:hypothetical protein